VSLSEKTDEIIGKNYVNPYQLQYLPIIPRTEKIYLDGTLLSKDVDYSMDYNLGQINIKNLSGLNEKIKDESVIKIDYRIIPITLQKTYQRKLFEPQSNPPLSPFTKGGINQSQSNPPFGKEGMKKQGIGDLETIPSDLTFTGTKSLSLSMESLSGLTINQPTRLNINGKVAGNINVSALLSDEDLPLQPEGTTENLEDLDKILIKIEGKHLSAMLGDYETSFGDTEFVLTPKQLEGAQAQGNFNVGGFTLIGAVSKGLSSSITLTGIEGQNEYRINVSGKYIIMVAGSEQVWLNGEKMRRERDYIVRDYGDPIVEFTNSHLITGQDVIVVDFEYVDEESNYGQKLYGIRGRLNPKNQKDESSKSLANFKFFGLESALGASYAIESDDKNNPIISLNNDDINSLKQNNLDPDGDGILLPAPMSSSVIGFDGRLAMGDNTFLAGEMALNKRDLNTFSIYDKTEEGKAWKLNGTSNNDRLKLNFDLRQFDPNFIPIGATANSRNRGTYQKNYDNIDFGGYQPTGQLGSSGHSVQTNEGSYNVDLWLEPIDKIELKGNMGKAETEYSLPEASKNITDHWSRGIRIALPNLPQIDTRYQEATTQSNGKDDSKRTRESLQLDHKLFKIINLKMLSEDFQSLNLNLSDDTDDIKRQERKFTLDLPSYKNISLSGELSLEKEFSSQQALHSAQINQPIGKTKAILKLTLRILS
jgi:hypothetical protein